jgi:hypothetical protein
MNEGCFGRSILQPPWRSSMDLRVPKKPLLRLVRPANVIMDAAALRGSLWSASEGTALKTRGSKEYRVPTASHWEHQEKTLFPHPIFLLTHSLVTAVHTNLQAA